MELIIDLQMQSVLNEDIEYITIQPLLNEKVITNINFLKLLGLNGEAAIVVKNDRYCLLKIISLNSKVDKVLEDASKKIESLFNNKDYLTDLQGRYSINIKNYANLVFLDIDNFKYINDNYGYDYGDLAIKKVVDSLKRYFPKESLFRYGGDEFIILTNLEVIALKKFFNHINQILLHEELSISYGIEEIDENQKLDFMIQRASWKMFLEKDRKK